MLTELGIAAALLAVVAGLAGLAEPASRPPPRPPTPIGWERSGVPTITALVQDVTAAEHDTADPSNASADALSGDDRHLRADLDTARRLAPPPGPLESRLWASSLADLEAAEHSLAAASTTFSPAAIAMAHQQIGLGAGGLLQLGQALTVGG